MIIPARNAGYKQSVRTDEQGTGTPVPCSFLLLSRPCHPPHHLTQKHPEQIPIQYASSNSSPIRPCHIPNDKGGGRIPKHISYVQGQVSQRIPKPRPNRRDPIRAQTMLICCSRAGHRRFPDGRMAFSLHVSSGLHADVRSDIIGSHLDISG